MLLARVARVFLLEFLRCFSFNFVFKNDFLVVPLKFFFQDEYFLRLFFFKNNKTDISNCVERQSYFRTDLNVSNQKHTKPQFNCKYSNENSNEKKQQPNSLLKLHKRKRSKIHRIYFSVKTRLAINEWQ